MDALTVIADVGHIRTGMSADPVFMLQEVRKHSIFRMIFIVVFRNPQLAVLESGTAPEVIAQKLYFFIGNRRIFCDSFFFHTKQSQLFRRGGDRKTASLFG